MSGFGTRVGGRMGWDRRDGTGYNRAHGCHLPDGMCLVIVQNRESLLMLIDEAQREGDLPWRASESREIQLSAWSTCATFVGRVCEADG